MSMTRKHYRLIAEDLHEAETRGYDQAEPRQSEYEKGWHDAVKYITAALSRDLKQDNIHFDSGKFTEAVYRR